MVINYLIAFGVYLAGYAYFVLNLMGEYKAIADAHPSHTVIFDRKVFWQKEYINILKGVMLGAFTPALLLPFSNLGVDFKNAGGDVMFTMSLKVILSPLYIVIGMGGGKWTLSAAGKYKQVLDEKIGTANDQINSKN